MKALFGFAILTVVCLSASLAQRPEDSPPFPDEMYAYFLCAVWAENAEMSAEEHLRLFERGFTLAVEWTQPIVDGTQSAEPFGARFLPGNPLGALAIGLGLSGPNIEAHSAEFLAGRVYQSVRTITFNNTLTDPDEPLPPDSEVVRRAVAQYQENACAEMGRD